MQRRVYSQYFSVGCSSRVKGTARSEKNAGRDKAVEIYDHRPVSQFNCSHDENQVCAWQKKKEIFLKIFLQGWKLLNINLIVTVSVPGDFVATR